MVHFKQGLPFYILFMALGFLAYKWYGLTSAVVMILVDNATEYYVTNRRKKKNGNAI